MAYSSDAQRLPAVQDLEQARDEVLERLGVHFAHDDIKMDELERRLSLAFRARDAAALEAVVADLPAPLYEKETGRPRYVTHDESVVPPRSVLGAFMGGTVRKGSWVVPRKLKVVAVMGGVELDFRQAVLGPGVTDIEVMAVMGGVDITVPSGVRVECMGMAVMGGFEASAGDASATDPSQPVIRLSGFALMGGVEARSKVPSAKSIKKFNKALLKARKETGDGSR
jgi:hypothetical protein